MYYPPIYRYALTILDPTNNTAVGGVLQYYNVNQYGDGSTNDTAGTQSSLVSNEVYVATVDNSTVAFGHGYTNGYIPGAGNGVFLFQHVNDTFQWEFTTQDIYTPNKLDLVLFETLGYQPTIIELTPDGGWPKPPKEASSEATFTGSAWLCRPGHALVIVSPA